MDGERPQARLGSLLASAQPDREALQQRLEELLAGSPMDCASISRFGQDGSLEVEATAGPTVFRRGAQMPAECSSNFARAIEGDAFVSEDLTSEPGFERSWDQVTLAVGWRSTCAVPLKIGSRVLGAISFCGAATDLSVDGTVDAAAAAEEQLVLALLGSPADQRASGRVVICADDRITAEGLARIVERQLTAKVEVSVSLQEATELVRAETDLVITDSHVNGLRIDQQSEVLRNRGVQPRMLVVSSFDTRDNRVAAARAGAISYVSRSSAPAEISAAVLHAAMGEVRIDLGDDLPSEASEALTRREGEVLVLLERGLQVKQIALALGISHSTVKGYLRNAFSKLGAHSTTSALYVARNSGLLQSLQSKVERDGYDRVR